MMTTKKCLDDAIVSVAGNESWVDWDLLLSTRQCGQSARHANPFNGFMASSIRTCAIVARLF